MTNKKMAVLNALLVLLFVILSACSQEDIEPAKLVTLGDSITAGANLENNEQSGYPYLIGEEEGFEVHNLAVSGWQTGQVTDALREDEAYQSLVKDADYIAMTIGGNDLLRILRSAQTESAGDPMIMTESFFRNSAAITFPLN